MSAVDTKPAPLGVRGALSVTRALAIDNNDHALAYAVLNAEELAARGDEASIVATFELLETLLLGGAKSLRTMRNLIALREDNPNDGLLARHAALNTINPEGVFPRCLDAIRESVHRLQELAEAHEQTHSDRAARKAPAS